MIKVIIYGGLALLLGLTRLYIDTPWLLITAPIWSPLATMTIDTIIHRVKRRMKDERIY